MNMFKRWQLSLKRKDKDFCLTAMMLSLKHYCLKRPPTRNMALVSQPMGACEHSRLYFRRGYFSYWIEQVRSQAGESAARFDIDWVDLRAHWLGRSTKELCKACSLSALH